MARQNRNGKAKAKRPAKQSKTKRKVAAPAQGHHSGAPGPRCPVVGVGASAGGLEAFQAFLSGLPSDTGIAYVLVQHLSPEHKSMLQDLLRRYTTMPVAEVAQDTPIEPNQIFVIPPNTTLTIKGAKLHLAPAKRRDSRMPIDDFFSSLAETLGERAACVILSGTGTDGTIGLRAIKEHGGLSLAQVEQSAKYDGMLRSAIATGLVDHVLPAEEMPAKLIEYFHPLTAIDGEKDADGVSPQTTAQLSRIVAVLGARTKHDFSGYKEKTVARRVQRRMQALQISSPDQYVKRLRSEPREVDLLFQDLLINVTNFFRDPAAFRALDGRVISPLVQDAKETIRVWVPGCATGEEAYSVGILLREKMAQMDGPPKVQIFATDIDDNALETARFGRYPLAIARDVSPERLARFFVKDEGAYRVVKELRDMCIFSVHNILRDPPFSKLDLISCRNLLIYLNAAMQSRLLQIAHYALRPGACLFLGNTESVAQQPTMFTTVDKAHHIFRWLPHAEPSIRFPFTPNHPGDRGDQPERPKIESRRSMSEAAEHIVLGYAPAYVVINAEQQVLNFSPRTGKYLEHPAGAPNIELLEMARLGLRGDLRVAVGKALQTGQRTVQPDVAFEADGSVHNVNIIVQPFGSNAARSSALYVVLFQDAREAKLESEGIIDEPKGEASALQQLGSELRQVRAQHQAITEEMEATNEELKSSNEELSSMNEELQSTNEELETSKEELQSINEELQTVNGQLQSSNDDLRRANSDMKNLLESTQIATLFLDGDMRIRSFTPAIADIFFAVASDHGRPINHIRTRLETTDFELDCRRVLRTLAPVEREISLADHSASYVMRIMPYRTIDNIIDGVVLTFFDITEREKRQEERALLAAIVDSSSDAICSVSLDGTITSWNAGAEKLYGYTAQEAVGRQTAFIVPPERASEALLDSRVRGGERIETLQTVRLAKDGRRLDVSVSISPIRDGAGKITSISIIARDIADRKRAELQRVMMAELNHRVKNSLAIVSALARRTLRNSASPEAFVQAFENRLKSFGRTHNALSQEDWAGIALRQLATAELQPYRSQHYERILMSGPNILLRPKAALAFGMTIHELASNAVKYGALSSSGRVEIGWELSEAHSPQQLAFRWIESGGPKVGTPSTNGLGRRLIMELMEYELGATVSLTFDPAGVQCRVELPLIPDIGQVIEAPEPPKPSA